MRLGAQALDHLVHLRRISLPTLEAAMKDAAQVDKMIKGLRAKAHNGDAWDAMLQLALKVARG